MRLWRESGIKPWWERAPREVAGSHRRPTLRSSLFSFALQTARSPRTRSCAAPPCPIRSLPRGAFPRNPTLPRLPMAPPSQRPVARAVSATECPSSRISGDLPHPPSHQVGPGRAALSDSPCRAVGQWSVHLMARRHHHKRVEGTDLPVPFKNHYYVFPRFARICSFRSFSGYFFRVAFPAHILLLREQGVTGCRRVVLTSGVNFLVYD